MQDGPGTYIKDSFILIERVSVASMSDFSV